MFGLISKKKLEKVIERIVRENCDYAPVPANANFRDWKNYNCGNLNCAGYLISKFKLNVNVVKINNEERVKSELKGRANNV